MRNYGNYGCYGKDILKNYSTKYLMGNKWIWFDVKYFDYIIQPIDLMDLRYSRLVAGVTNESNGSEISQTSECCGQIGLIDLKYSEIFWS